MADSRYGSFTDTDILRTTYCVKAHDWQQISHHGSSNRHIPSISLTATTTTYANEYQNATRTKTKP